MSNWKKYKLGEIGSFFGGVTSISKEDYGHGTPFLPYKNVYKNSKVNTNELELMNVRALDLERRSAIYGDIFFTASSETPDEVAMSSVLLDEIENLTFNGFCKRFRLNNFNTLLPEYARYLFRDISFRREVYQLATGDIRFNISQESLANIEIKIPNLPTQTQIAQILTSFDDKIELLEQMNKTLETIAQTIFKEWFVNFNYPGSELGYLGLNDNRIINSMRVNSKGIIESDNPKNHNSDNLPKGWRMGKLG
jgi:type I restriction enzyme S subunit